MKKLFALHSHTARGNVRQLMTRVVRWLENLSACDAHAPATATYGLLVMAPHSLI